MEIKKKIIIIKKNPEMELEKGLNQKKKNVLRATLVFSSIIFFEIPSQFYSVQS